MFIAEDREEVAALLVVQVSLGFGPSASVPVFVPHHVQFFFLLSPPFMCFFVCCLSFNC